MQGSTKIIFNTGITYARAVVTALISLYSTRVVLSSLGASDFGIFNVIGGVVAMLAFLNAAMTTSTQRYLSFNLGKGDLSLVKKIFANSVVIHLVIGLIIVLFIEGIASYLIGNKLQIDSSRIEVARYILHFTVASTFITVISVPYDAVVNAHENMIFLAIVTIIEAILKLLVALSLFIVPGDKLFYFGLLTMFSAILIRLIKRTYSKRKYEECRITIMQWYDLREIKELTSFASWQLFGTLCSLGRNQGVAIVLNFFYSTVVNAAYGIANQINAQLMFFSQTMMSAMRPQIMKSEGSNDRDRVIRLSLSANRLSFYLFTFFALPLYFQMPFVLDLWLKEVPQYTVEFCRAILLLTMANQINMGLMTAVQAIGKIKLYQTVAGGIQLLTLPIGFWFLKIGYPSYSIVLVSFVLECISTVFRVFYFRYLTGYPAWKYFLGVILRSVLTLLPAAIFLIIIGEKLPEGITGFLVCIISSILIYVGSLVLYGLDRSEKRIFKEITRKLFKIII